MKRHLLAIALGSAAGSCTHANLDSKLLSGLNCNVQSVQQEDTVFSGCEEDLSSKVLSEFKLVREVKAFGRSMGLEQSSNYLVFKSGHENSKKETYASLIVCPEFKLSEKLRAFYLKKGNFRKVLDEPFMVVSTTETLADEEQFYKGLYDTNRSVVMDFVSHSNHPDITPEFMESPLRFQVETILHEKWHVTFSRHAGKEIDRLINEATANFIGTYGAAEFARIKYGENSEEFKEAKTWRDDWVEFASRVNRLYTELGKTYAMDIPDYEKTSIKNAAFRREGKPNWNNALILRNRPYTKYLTTLVKIHERYPKLSEMVEILKETPAKAKDAEAYFKSLLE